MPEDLQCSLRFFALSLETLQIDFKASLEIVFKSLLVKVCRLWFTPAPAPTLAWTKVRRVKLRVASGLDSAGDQGKGTADQITSPVFDAKQNQKSS